MEIVLHALNGVLTIILMIAVGFYLERRGWFSEESVALISRLVNYVCLPTYMLTNILGQFKHDQLITLSHGLIVPVISMLAGYFISRLLGRLIGVPREHRGIFSICVSFSNTIFIGLPLGIALFGDSGAPYIMIYYMVNTTLFWTIGFHDLASSNGVTMPLFSRKTLKSIMSPPLMGFMLGVVMVLLEWNLPEPVFKSFHYLGSMTTPLAMLFIGIAMNPLGRNCRRQGAGSCYAGTLFNLSLDSFPDFAVFPSGADDGKGICNYGGHAGDDQYGDCGQRLRRRL